MDLLGRISSKLSSYPLDETITDTIVFDLQQVGGGPLSPPCQEPIPMDDEFRAEVFTSAFIRNLLHSQASLTVTAWRKIVSFCSQDHSAVSTKVGLQLLLLFSKVDPIELKARANQTFDELLSDVARLLSEFSAQLMDNDRTIDAKQFLQGPAILKAMKDCLVEVEKTNFADSAIPNRIDSMRLYSGNVRLPIRGACLRDGVFVNFEALAATTFPQINRADLMTLLCHETAHFLIRSIENDYNFSSPFAADGSIRTEKGDANKNLELGRSMELKLFGMQPLWRRSTAEAAEKFLLLAQNPTAAIPLEVGSGLAQRPVGSLSMGIDLDLEEVMFE